MRILFSLVFSILTVSLLKISFDERSISLLFLAGGVFAACMALLLRRYRALFVVLASTCVALAATEAATRWIFRPATALVTPVNTVSPVLNHRHTDIGLQTRPNVYAANLTDPSGRAIYDVIYTIGADGFRVTPRPVDDPLTRINLFGGSFTFGQGVEDEETVAAVLAEALSATEVRNFGQPGYGVHQAVAILESGRDTAGEINILLTSGNHVRRSDCSSRMAVSTPRYVRLPDGKVMRDGFCSNRVKTLLDQVLSRWLFYQWILASVTTAWELDADAWSLYAALVNRFIAISQERGQVAIVAQLPDYGAETRFAWKRFASTLLKDGHLVVDISLADAQGVLADKYVLDRRFDLHPSAEANRVRGLILAEYVRPILEDQAIGN